MYNAGFVEQAVALGLVLLHVSQDTAHADVVRIDQSKGSDVDEVVLKVLKVERFNILARGKK